MAKYNLLKLKNYLVHLTIGALIFVFGSCVLYGIISEMVNAYDIRSKYAYICGIAASVIIIIIGIWDLLRAFGFEKRVLRKLTAEEKELFFDELKSEQAKFFDRYLFVTPHYVMVYVKTTFFSKVSVLKIEDLVGCFGNPHFASSEEVVQYDIILCDQHFHLYRCMVKGKFANKMQGAQEAVCTYAPWVFSDDYLDFISGLTKRKKKKSYLKIIEHRKQSMIKKDVHLIEDIKDNGLE